MTAQTLCTSITCADPVYALITAHADAARALSAVLSLPEDAEHLALRSRDEVRTLDAMEAAEEQLTYYIPQTLAGTAAALRYFASAESDLLSSMEERHARYLSVLVRRLTELLGQPH